MHNGEQRKRASVAAPPLSSVGPDLAEQHIDWLLGIVQIGCPQYDHGRTANAANGENPKEESVQNHGHELPVFFNLQYIVLRSCSFLHVSLPVNICPNFSYVAKGIGCEWSSDAALV